jgi:hypothetical protein
MWQRDNYGNSIEVGGDSNWGYSCGFGGWLFNLGADSGLAWGLTASSRVVKIPFFTEL